MTQDEKLDEALKGTFPASDAFYLSPERSPGLIPSQTDRGTPSAGLLPRARLE